VYACFKKIPRDIRQQAFEVMAANTTYSGRAVVDGLTYCPWGVVNLVVQPALVSDDMMLRVPGPTHETIFIRTSLEVNIFSDDISRFMDDADIGKFNTPEKLARAMGAKYVAP
jgi:hypothetical protein